MEHAKGKHDTKYLRRGGATPGRRFDKVRAMLGQRAVGIARIAKKTGLTTPPLRVKTQAVPRFPLSPGGPKMAVLPSADSATDWPWWASHLLGLPLSSASEAVALRS
jgi:hypothetical protein